MSSLRTIFMGTPELARISLQALIQSPDFQVVAVVTQPDRPKGRDLKPQPSPVKVLASQANLPILQPERARNPEFIQALREVAPDVIAVAAYGQILPPSILDLPRFGCLNVHTSLLPRYRGAAPIQWAILNGDPETGVTIMKMDAGMDTGPILTQEITPIQPEDTSESLHDRLASLGAALMLQTIPDYVAGKIQARPQPSDGVSHAPKIKKSDGQIDWKQPAASIWNRVRGLVPWPGAFTHLESPESSPAGVASPPSPNPLQGQLLKIWQAQVVELSGTAGQVLQADRAGILVACGRDALCIQILQREGGRRLAAAEFLAGHPMHPGLHLK